MTIYRLTNWLTKCIKALNSEVNEILRDAKLITLIKVVL